MKLRNSLVLIILLACVCLQAQEYRGLRLAEVTVNGLTKTQLTVVDRLLQKEKGDQVTSEDIAYDAQQLQNYPALDEVEFTIDTIGEEVKVTYTVSEIRTLLPILNFGGIEGNVWYQVGFTDNNWLGKGHTINTYYQNSDSRHSGEIFYSIPQLGKSRWGISGTLSRWASVEPLFFPGNVSVSYNYDFNNLGLTGIYRVKHNKKIEFGGSYFVERYQKLGSTSQVELPGPDQLTQPKILARINYSEDYIRYFAYQQEGFAWTAFLNYVRNFSDNTNFTSLILQAKYFHMPNKLLNIAVRARFAISDNVNSPFAPFVVDSHVNLRGVGNRIDRGTAQVILNVEARSTISERKKWVTQLVLFTDAGTWRNPGGNISDLLEPDQFRQFIGGGFRLIYKKIYGAIIRIDYGVDIYNTTEKGVVIGFGQYF